MVITRGVEGLLSFLAACVVQLAKTVIIMMHLLLSGSDGAWLAVQMCALHMQPPCRLGLALTVLALWSDCTVRHQLVTLNH